ERIPVGVDGEALNLSVPVRCEARPGALRVLVPRERPGMRSPLPRLDWPRIARLALPSARGRAHPGAERPAEPGEGAGRAGAAG
ncbi:diacylglycerol kinase, partial [Streptomyces sp. NPDC060205]